MATEDAVVLARALRDTPDVAGAFTAFERAKRPLVEKIVAEGARTSITETPGPVGRVLRDAILPLVFRYVVTERSLAWKYDHRVEWERPALLDRSRSPARFARPGPASDIGLTDRIGAGHAQRWYRFVGSGRSPRSFVAVPISATDIGVESGRATDRALRWRPGRRARSARYSRSNGPTSDSASQ